MIRKLLVLVFLLLSVMLVMAKAQSPGDDDYIPPDPKPGPWLMLYPVPKHVRVKPTYKPFNVKHVKPYSRKQPTTTYKIYVYKTQKCCKNLFVR